MVNIFGTTESLGLNITTGNIFTHYFMPIIFPAILVIASVSFWRITLVRMK